MAFSYFYRALPKILGLRFRVGEVGQRAVRWQVDISSMV